MVKSNVPGFLAIAAGVIALITGLTGSIGLYETVFMLFTELAATYVPPEAVQLFAWVLFILGFFASLGGISVIIGGILILLFNRLLLGRLLISLGIGVGLVGLITNIFMVLGGTYVTQYLNIVGLPVMTGLTTIQAVAVVLSIIARHLTKKVD